MPPQVAPPQHIDSDSTYYVHPSKGPNTINFIYKLDGSNYLAWSKSMACALGAKNKLKLVDGTIQIPTVRDLNFS